MTASHLGVGLRPTENLLAVSSENASLGALHIYCTDYSRGAIVKLAESHSHQPIAKFIVQKKHGQYEVLSAHSPGSKPEHAYTFRTYHEATGYAIRECERIRDHFAGGLDGPG